MTSPALRARVNPFFLGEPVIHPSRQPVRAFHVGLPGYLPTPLLDRSGMAQALGLGRVYLKDEGQRLGLLAFKGLGASWALHRLLERHPSLTTVSAATDGNHGHAVAWAASQLGLQSVIFIPAHAAPARIERIRRAGGRVELVEGSYDEAVRRCARESAARGWQVVADVGYDGYLEVPRLIAEGYSTLFQESEEQLAASGWPRPTVAIIQAGVGGLLHAAVDHFRALPGPPMLVAVEPSESDPLFTSIGSPGGVPTVSRGRQDSIMAGLNCGEVSLSAWPVVRQGVELFVTIPDGFAEEAMRLLARPPGRDAPVAAGETGAAGLGGLLALCRAPGLQAAREFLRLGPASRVLLLNTEGVTDPDGYRRIVGPAAHSP